MTAVLILIVILLAIAVAVLARRVVNLQRGLDRADARQKAAVNTSRSVHVGKIARSEQAECHDRPCYNKTTR